MSTIWFPLLHGRADCSTPGNVPLTMGTHALFTTPNHCFNAFQARVCKLPLFNIDVSRWLIQCSHFTMKHMFLSLIFHWIISRGISSVTPRFVKKEGYWADTDAWIRIPFRYSQNLGFDNKDGRWREPHKYKKSTITQRFLQNVPRFLHLRHVLYQRLNPTEIWKYLQI